MNTRLLKIIISLGTLLGLDAHGDEFYTVQKGERISDILFKKNISPIYGKHGALQKVLELNPYLKAYAGDLILPGTRILLAVGENAPKILTAQQQNTKFQR